MTDRTTDDLTRSSPQYLSLHGRHSSVVLEFAANEAPLWRYWGPRLADHTAPPSSSRRVRPAPPASLEFDQPLSIAPTFGMGWFGRAALLAHRSGEHFSQQWQSCTFEFDAAPPNAQCLTFTLGDAVAALSLIVTLRLDAASDVLTIQSSLRNDGKSILDLQWLAAATLALPDHCRNVQYFTGEWANEFQPETQTLSRAGWHRENLRGRTSHDCFPGAMILCDGTSDHAGHVYGAHLGWSGNHAQYIEWQHDGGYQWQLGEWLAPGEVRLAPGETLASPIAFAAFSPNGLNGLAQCFHTGVRAILPWPNQAMSPRRVHLNTWEAVYFAHDGADLAALATSAAELGVERFVLDDGWFHGREGDRAGLGDWWADERKYPDGMLPLAKHIEACGMSFGLWVEPEMVNADSDLYRAHPDWALQLDGRPLLTGRHQLVLDISRADVAEYLFTRLQSLLTSLPIAYVKWDMNRDLAGAGSNGRAAYRRHVFALYKLLARLRAAHPALEIESCASGGGRIDYGILGHTHRVWASDCNDALARVGIQRGALRWLPPEIIGAHVGSVPSHTTGRSQSLAFRAAVALSGHFGLEMDVRKLSLDERAELTQWIALYKRLRHELHQSTVWQGNAGDGVVWQAHGTTTSLILLVYRLTPTAQRWVPRIRLPMLDVEREYIVERIDPNAHLGPSLPYASNALNPVNNTARGDWLVNDGIASPRMLAETALVLRIAIPQ